MQRTTDWFRHKPWPASLCQHAAVLRWGVCCLVLLTGCVERRMTIRSNPPGALATVSGGKYDSPSDEHEIGFTPVSTNYVYNGVRRITLVKDGHMVLTDLHDFKPRWYEVFPLEFFAENVVPWRIRDHRILNYELTPQKVTPTQPLLRRGEEFRQRHSTGG